MERESLVYKAKLAEQCERYNDMKSFMKQVAENVDEVTYEERNLVSVAYKNYVGLRRTSWRMITDPDYKSAREDDNETFYQEYKKVIEDELEAGCREVLSLIDDHLLKKSKSVDSEVFLLKMKADYYRYIAEVKSGAERDELAKQAQAVYADAYKIAQQLSPIHPIRLGLALNFSVFYYEIMYSSEKACELAKSAFDMAIPELDNEKSDDNRTDTTVILQLIRDNLTLWNSTSPPNEENDGNAANYEAYLDE